MRVQTLLAHLRQEQAQYPHQPALERIIANDAARHRDAKQGQPEEFESAKRECHLGQGRCEGRQAQHAKQGADESARGRDADGTPGLSLHGQRIAVSARGRVGCSARNVEQDGGARAAVQRANIGTDKNQDRVIGLQFDGQRGQQCDRERGRQAGQDAHDDADESAAQAIGQRHGIHEAEPGVPQIVESLKHDV